MMNLPLSPEEIRSFLPHRYPFLLVDRILKIEPVFGPDGRSTIAGSRVVGVKNVTLNEPIFSGHFPHYSIFPGVLMLEVMAQVSSFAFYPAFVAGGRAPFECILLGADSVRWRHPVVPGDQVLIESEMTRNRGTIFGFNAVAKVDGKVVAEAEVLANLAVRKTGVAS